MESEFRPLEEVVEDILDRRGVTPFKLGGEFVESGHRVISAKLVKDGRVNLDAAEPRYVDAAIYKKWMKSPLRCDDVIMTSEAPLGELAYLDQNRDWVLGQRLFAIRPRKNVLSGKFLYYVLATQGVRDSIIARASGTTVQGIRQAELRKVEIPVPPLKVQIEAAEVLGTLDDRIDNLRQTNATLEAIAQALFKSWFVDFDPVRAKAEGREPEGMDAATAALFPSEFEDSERGPIPKGWEVRTLGEICSLAWGNTSLTKKFYVDVGVRAFSAAGQDGLIAHSEHRGVGSVISAIGTVGIVHLAFGEWTAIKNTLVAKGDTEVESAYLHFLLKTIRFPARGSTQQFISQGDARAVPVLHPPEQLRNYFGITVKALIDSYAAHVEISEQLQIARDTLLPRLISGKLRLPEAEARIDEAAA